MRHLRQGRAWFCWVGLSLVVQLALGGCAGGSASKATGPGVPSSITAPDFDFGANDRFRVTAFGDSITRGVLGEGAITNNNYPNRLQAMLRGLNPTWRVINRGSSGERTSEGARRLPGVLAADRPGFVLILEGTNDASEGDDPGSVVANLERMVEQARGNRSIPVVGTIPPNFRNDPGAQAIISAANSMIRTMARTRGVALAEIFNGMNDRSLFGSPELGIDDPLHPNERGYTVMADIWFNALQRAIPAPPPPTTTASGGTLGSPTTEAQRRAAIR